MWYVLVHYKIIPLHASASLYALFRTLVAVESASFFVTMSKHHILIDLAQPSTSKHSKLHCPTNRELCANCQVETGRFAMPCQVKQATSR